MDFDKLAYPETITIAGIEYKAQRDMSKGQVLIPYTDEPDVGIGDGKLHPCEESYTPVRKATPLKATPL